MLHLSQRLLLMLSLVAFEKQQALKSIVSSNATVCMTTNDTLS